MRYYLLLLFLVSGLLVSCKAPYTGYTSSFLYYSPGTPSLMVADSILLDEIYPYQTKLNGVMNEVLAYSEMALEKGQPESRLGNFVADLCFATIQQKYQSTGQPTVDFCILNNGGLRSSLPAGAITRKNVFELMPFENELVVLTLHCQPCHLVNENSS